MGELRILGKEGDTKVIWDPDNKDEVKAAREQFDTLKAKKFLAFRVSRTKVRRAARSRSLIRKPER